MAPRRRNPKGAWGLRAVFGVARHQRWHRIASSSRLESGPQEGTAARRVVVRARPWIPAAQTPSASFSHPARRPDREMPGTRSTKASPTRPSKHASRTASSSSDFRRSRSYPTRTRPSSSPSSEPSSSSARSRDSALG